jgi:hypothetical protein
LFVVHGFAHAAVGVWAAEVGRWWLVGTLWELAMVGFIAAGLGALGLGGLRDIWRVLAAIAASASILLFLSAPQRTFLLGLAADITVLVLISYSDNAPEPQAESPARPHPVRHALQLGFSWLLLLYVAAVIAIRPWNLQWGTSAAERAMPLPGDQLTPVAHYRIDHGITVNAPVSAVWPWLAQIGQDRGGFYSYSALENAIGAQVTNAEQIVPEWQTRRVGDLVRAVPEDWMGGRFGNSIGWRVLQLVPGRAMVLENWGAFVLVPINDSTTRMFVRTRGPGIPSQASVAMSPIGLLVFEPAHLLMERRMLLGIKQRSETNRDKPFLVEQYR